jgi:hypothetical protein
LALGIAAVAAAAMSLALKPGNFGGLEFFLRCLQADALSARSLAPVDSQSIVCRSLTES